MTQKIVFFTSDVYEPAQLRRIEAIQALGAHVTSIGMHRSASQRLSWPHIDLGETAYHAFAKRFMAIFSAVKDVLPHAGVLREADVIIARNFDMLLLARLVMKRLNISSAKLVYECLDIHGIFTNTSIKGRFARLAERGLLKKIDRLVVSSPGFIENYFEPVQHYTGDVCLVENKLIFRGPIAARRLPAKVPETPFRLGLVGAIRCQPSVDLLVALARNMADSVEIHFHGQVHEHVVTDFENQISNVPNITYHGAYKYPDALVKIYQGLDAVWAQDMWQLQENSSWLLPNRIYEASYFGCPQIALSDTQTGKTISQRGTGVTIDAADHERLAQKITDLSDGGYAILADSLSHVPDTLLVTQADDMRAIITFHNND